MLSKCSMVVKKVGQFILSAAWRNKVKNAVAQRLGSSLFFWRKRCQSQIFHAWTSNRSWTYVTKLIRDCVSIASSCKSSWRGLPCLEAREFHAGEPAEAHYGERKSRRNTVVRQVKLGLAVAQNLVG